MYPITVLKQSGRARSSSGGKDYHLVLIQNVNGKSLVIHRWGRARQWGNGWKLEQFDDPRDADRAYAKKYSEKMHGEYTDHFLNKNITVNDAGELQKALGHQYMKQIGKAIAHVDPSFDTTKLRDPQPETEWEKGPDGRTRVKERVRKLVEQPPEPPEDRAAINPLWGTWG